MHGNIRNLRPLPHVRSAGIPEFITARMEKYYRERVQQTWGGGHIMRGRVPGKGALQLSSNDYLSLHRHPAILAALSESLAHDSNSLLMSGIFLHGNCPQLRFEERLARFMQAEAGVLCQSGYCANTGLIQAIANDQTRVYIDMMAHMSLWEGIKSAGAKAITFVHNDVEHLERQIRRHGPGIVLVDSVYSTTGCLAPLKEITDIVEAQGCVLVVDESHSLGTHGPRGEGQVVALGLAERVHFRTASLAKAFAGRAGFITCSKPFQEYFKFESLPAIFSSSLLPFEVKSLNATLGVIQTESWRRARLHANAAYLRSELTALGYHLNHSSSQIISLEPGTEQRAIVLRDALESRNLFGSIFCAPATPKNRALMRFSINSGLAATDLEHIVGACREIRDEVDLSNWPSTRRMQRDAPTASLTMVPEHALATGT